MSLRRWFARPLSRFFRMLWLDRIDLVSSACMPPATKESSRRATRPTLEGLETRETPDDLFAILAGGVSLGGLGMLLPPHQTPQSALVNGFQPPLSSSTPVDRQSPLSHDPLSTVPTPSPATPESFRPSVQTTFAAAVVPP